MIEECCWVYYLEELLEQNQNPFSVGNSDLNRKWQASGIVRKVVLLSLYNCWVFKIPGILGNINCLWYQLVLVFQWCHTIYRFTQWISCLWTYTGVQIVLEKQRNWGLIVCVRERKRGRGKSGDGEREWEREFYFFRL